MSSSQNLDFVSFLTLRASAIWIVAGAGFVSHVGYFIRGEHHLSAPILVRLLLIAFALLTVFQMRLTRTDFQSACWSTLCLIFAYCVALFGSTITYRAFFHPLKGYPGPAMAKITKLWHVSKISNLDNYRQVERLHAKYGDFVRTGPNEVSISRPEALPALLGPNSPCIKSSWYDGIRPKVAMNTIRDKAAHEQRRRIWDRAFSVKALASYEGRVDDHISRLHSKITRSHGHSLDMTKLFGFFSFDVMGDLSFGKQFAMLESEKQHFAIDTLRQGMLTLGLFTPVPWLFIILITTPGLMRKWNEMIRWSVQEVDRRIKAEPDVPDIFTWLLEASSETSTVEKDRLWLDGDSLLAIIAGSETVSAALIFIFKYLAQDSGHVNKLREELDPLNGDFTNQNLQNLQHLNAVIHETLRLHPPVPSGLLRQTPPEGITLAGCYIPGGVTVIAPNHVISRLETCFDKPLQFIPERWTSAPDMVKNKDAVAPFSLGPYSCIGKNLAMMEMRKVVARLVTDFDIQYSPEEDGEAALNNMIDTFTTTPGSLRLVFDKRR